MDLTCSEPPGHATHWTGRAMAKAVCFSLRAVQRLWEAHRLQPHRIRTLKRSNDPQFVEKVENIVGLYMDHRSTRRAKSKRSTARNRACRSSPRKCGTMTHDYKRNGTRPRCSPRSTSSTEP